MLRELRPTSLTAYYIILVSPSHKICMANLMLYFFVYVLWYKFLSNIQFSGVKNLLVKTHVSQRFVNFGKKTMITKEDLYKLGYEIKTSRMHNNSTDYRFSVDDVRPYLLNLSKDGTVVVDFPINKPQKPFSTNKLSDFIEWHNNYKSPKD